MDDKDVEDSDIRVKLSETGETIKLDDEDIRGYAVKDKDGADVGKIEDLLIDKRENKVRFFVVASGGFLGLGETKSFIPVDAITRIDHEEVHIDQNMEKVAAAPPYDPELVNDRDYNETNYTHFGYDPFWMTGGSYPGLLL